MPAAHMPLALQTQRSLLAEAPQPAHNSRQWIRSWHPLNSGVQTGRSLSQWVRDTPHWCNRPSQPVSRFRHP